MRTIIVNDDEIVRKIFQTLAGTNDVLNVVGAFDNSGDAIDYAKNYPVDLAILDISMKKMDGIELGYKLRGIHPRLMLIYLTPEDIYDINRLQLRIAAYLLKPAEYQNYLQNKDGMQVKMQKKHSRKHIYVRTFGYFDVFVDGKAVLFRSAKAKELLALLIDRRGGSVTSDQIITVLWENRPNDESTQNLCSKIVKVLKQELDEYGIGDILIRRRGIRSVDVTQIDCDMYDLMAGKTEAKENFFGDYMLQYSWAEERIGMLWKKARFILSNREER